MLRFVSLPCHMMLVSGLFVPLHFRSREKKVVESTFAPMELSLHGTFARGEQKDKELSFHGTFAPLELSLLRSECSKNFRSMELSHPWNVRSTNNFRADRAPVELSLLYLKKLWKAGKQCVYRRILANIRCCILEWKRCHVGLYNNSLKNHRLEQSKV